MDTQGFVIESSAVPWKSLAREDGGTTQIQLYLRGADGGPEAIRAQISEGSEVEPHFHAKQLGPKNLRFIAAGEEAMPLRCGLEGATIIVLTYDQDAAQSYGGSTEEVIAQMER